MRAARAERGEQLAIGGAARQGHHVAGLGGRGGALRGEADRGARGA